jgi:hypothetical protein
MHHTRTNLNLQVAADAGGTIVLFELGDGDYTCLVQAFSLHLYSVADAFGIEEGDMAGAHGHDWNRNIVIRLLFSLKYCNRLPKIASNKCGAFCYAKRPLLRGKPGTVRGRWTHHSLTNNSASKDLESGEAMAARRWPMETQRPRGISDPRANVPSPDRMLFNLSESAAAKANCARMLERSILTL